MKKIIAVAACISCMMFAACDNTEIPVVAFKEAQPADVNPLSVFPERIRGKYTDQEQRKSLSIDEHRILEIEDYDFGIKIKELDSSYTLKGDTLYDNCDGTWKKVIVQGDSIWQHIHDIDTMFDMTDSRQIAKQFKGHYFLNWGFGNGWMVGRLSLEKGKLLLASISDSTAISQLQTLAEKPLDTVTHLCSIQKKQFKAFIRNHGFTDVDTFFRISK